MGRTQLQVLGMTMSCAVYREMKWRKCNRSICKSRNNRMKRKYQTYARRVARWWNGWRHASVGRTIGNRAYLSKGWRHLDSFTIKFSSLRSIYVWHFSNMHSTGMETEAWTVNLRLKFQLSRGISKAVLSQVICLYLLWSVCLFHFEVIPETNQSNAASNSESNWAEHALWWLIESAVSPRACAGEEWMGVFQTSDASSQEWWLGT